MLQPAAAGEEYMMHRFTVDEYHRLAAAGILTEDDSVELLEGWLVAKMTRSPRHDACISRIERVLRRLLPPGWVLRIQSAITTCDSQPEPDLAIVREKDDDYALAHPGPEDVGLVIEVADTSLMKDRRKAQIYAGAGISTIWVINLNSNQVECFSKSQPTTNGDDVRRSVHSASDNLTVWLDGGEVGNVAVGDLIPAIS